MDEADPGRRETPGIDHAPLGHPGDHARREFIGLYVYLVSMAAFLTWLIAYGVNV